MARAAAARGPGARPGAGRRRGGGASWRPLASARRLALRFTLENGQCFGWRPRGLAAEDAANAGHAGAHAAYVGVVRGLAVHLRELRGNVEFRILADAHKADVIVGDDDHEADVVVNAAAAAVDDEDDNDEDDAEDDRAERVLRDYFQLDTDMEALCSEWSEVCPRIASVSRALPGMRILRQDPFECLIAFICSSNNNIARITLMLDRLRAHYGELLVAAAPKTDAGDDGKNNEAATRAGLYAFPTPAALGRATEAELREMGFGYRAKYIVNSLSKLQAQEGGPDAWLASLRAKDQSEESLRAVREALLTLDGVGPKVADCVALFCLDRRSVIPVDTHVWQIACRDFDPGLLEAKSLTPKIYERVGDLFRQRYGPFAGWAHSLLFAAELPQFLSLLPEELQAQVATFAAEEKARKAQLRDEKKLAAAQKKPSSAVPKSANRNVGRAAATRVKVEAHPKTKRKGAARDTAKRPKVEDGPATKNHVDERNAASSLRSSVALPKRKKASTASASGEPVLARKTRARR